MRSEAQESAQTRINPQDSAEMIYIPAGDFLMGDEDEGLYIIQRDHPPWIPSELVGNNNPRHTVRLSGYWIYKNLVTVGIYKRFCQEIGMPMPAAPAFNPNWSREDHPIVNVSWTDTMACCQWASQAGVTVSLPTEAQWEKAARGTDGRKYPWGNRWDARKLWCSKNEPGDAGGTASVGKYAISPYGLTDMAGKVWQWCRDWFDQCFWCSPAASVADPENQIMFTNRGKCGRNTCACRNQ
ncbi:MAG TPA: SUMF1/EgtB/PvdO family nonheme iron enzyme [Chthonomonadaceae bacterium]|nr:SUMF1/EgtB/PvdO family nonheme iron enzyme [Chthonomonadaceae bacterium]